jgi:hypothetical protein
LPAGGVPPARGEYTKRRVAPSRKATGLQSQSGHGIVAPAVASIPKPERK